MSLDAMKQALEALEELADEVFAPYDNKLGDAILALRAAIEQAQDPETELETYKRLYELRGKALERPCSNCGHQPAKIKAMAQPEQKPVGWFGYDEKISTWFETNEGEDDSVPLYAGARGWEGLTPEETVGIELSLRKYHDDDRYDLSLSDFARAIEAKLKEKNT